MKGTWRFLARLIEYSPRLTVGVLLIFSILLTISTLAYVSQTKGIGLIVDIPREGAIGIMSLLILFIFIWLGYRIVYINRYVKKRAYAIARDDATVGRVSRRNEQERVKQARLFMLEISVRGNILKRLATIITWHAELFVYMLFFLSFLYGGILWCYYSECEYGRDCQQVGHSWLWRNCPWLAVGLVTVYLIINDWFVMQGVYRFLRNLMYLAEFRRQAMANQVIRPQSKLTPAEQIIYTKRIEEGKRLKEIANELHVSVGTVKTHINNIGKKLHAPTEPAPPTKLS